MSTPKTQTDQSGIQYQTPNNQPATYGQTVQVVTPNGLQNGIMLGGTIKVGN